LDEKFQLLKLINEIRGLSDVPLAYQVFDTKSQHLKDLNDEYESLKTHDLVASNRMKWSRIIAMFLGVNKDQTRAIDEDFIDEDVVKRLDANAPSAGILDSFKKVQQHDDLDDILGEQPILDEKVDAKELAKAIIRDRVDEKGLISIELTAEFDDLRKKFVLSAEEIITKNKRKSLLATPADELREIRESLENVVSLFNEVSHQGGFDAKKFEYELSKTNKSLEDLNKKFVTYKSK
jgi:hypothetical protein